MRVLQMFLSLKAIRSNTPIIKATCSLSLSGVIDNVVDKCSGSLLLVLITICTNSMGHQTERKTVIRATILKMWKNTAIPCLFHLKSVMITRIAEARLLLMYLWEISLDPIEQM